MRNNTVRRFGDVQSSSSNSNFYGNYNHSSNQANGNSTSNKGEDFQVDFEEERPIRPPNPVPGYHSYNNYSRGTYSDQGGLNQYGRKKRHPKHMPLKKTELELFQNGVEQGERFGDQYGFDRDDEIFVSGGSDESAQGLRIQNFQECGFSQILLDTITQCCKYEYPTPIQRAVIPLIMKKSDDIMGYSQTGSGKTAAFLIPIIHELQRIIQTNNHQNMRLPKNSPLCIILSPTKELAEQLYHNALKFAVKTGVTVARSFGDMPMRETLAERERGCDIFVVTPGRLRHHLDDAHIDISHLRYFVLDEGDKLIEERHFNVSIDACKLHPNYPPTTRLLIFSASFTDIVQSMADNYLREGYIFVKIGQINELVDTVEQEFIEVTKIDKAARLLEILQTDAVEKIRPDQSGRYFKPKYKTLIFVDNKRISDRTAMYLKQQGFTGTMSINSDRSLKQRMDAYEKFKNGQYDVLVATDVASRGWDISKIELVINYDLPMQESGDESFIHRIGRTGRAGNVGKAISFFDPYDQSNVQKADIYIKLLRAKNSNVPEFLLRHSTENREEKRQQVYMEGRIYGERENAWGGDRNRQNYFEQENDYLKMRANNVQNNGMNSRMNLNEPQNGWGPSNFNQNGRPMNQQNNFNGMASTSATKKPPINIFDLDDDDDEEEENGQSSSRQNVPTYQAPNNYRDGPQPLNNYQPRQNGNSNNYGQNRPRPLNSFHQHQPPQNGYTGTGTYQNGNQQNNLNRNGRMASTSAPKKPPINIFDLDDDDEGVEEDITTIKYGQSSSSKPNISAYQAPNNYGNEPPKTMNNYQPNKQNGCIGAYQNGNRQNMEKNHSSNFNNNSDGFPVQKERDQTRFPSPSRNRDINKQQRYGIRADLKEQKYDDCF